MPDVSAQVNTRPQHLLLTLLGDFWLGREEALPSAALVDILQEFDVSTSNARAALSRLARRGLLLQARSGRRTAYALTGEGSAVLADGTRRIFGFGASSAPWDGTWTVVAFSIPEGDRGARHLLRTRLRWEGFAPLYDGVWVAHGDREATAAATLAGLGIERATIVIGAASGTTPTAAWDLDALRRDYTHFLTTFAPVHERAAHGLTGAAEALIARTALIDVWRTFPALDPELPDELLAPDWPRDAARALFIDAYDALGPLATVRFRALIEPYDPELAQLAAHHTAGQAVGLAAHPPPDCC